MLVSHRARPAPGGEPHRWMARARHLSPNTCSGKAVEMG